MDLKEGDKNQLNVLIDKAMKNYDKVDEGDIYRNIGTSLISLGLEADKDSKSKSLLKEKEPLNFKEKPINSTDMFVSNVSKEIPAENAEKTGKNFWNVFKEKARYYICENDDIITLIKNDEIDKALKGILTSVLVPMGISGLMIPAVAVIAIGILMLLLKVGIKSLCKVTE